MILTCPSCGTRYQTDRTRFSQPGMNVRCAKCGHVWFHALTEIEPEPQSEPERAAAPAAAPEPPAPSAVEAAPAFRAAGFAPSAPETTYAPPLRAARIASEPERESRIGARVAVAAGWIALLLLIATTAWAVVTYRQTIAELWPRASSFYAAIGMPVNVRGLTFQDVNWKYEYEEGTPVLSLTGKVMNVSRRELPVPEIHVSLSDSGERELYHWNFDSGVSVLKPGESKDFVTRLTTPPADSRGVDISFVQSDETPAER